MKRVVSLARMRWSAVWSTVPKIILGQQWFEDSKLLNLWRKPVKITSRQLCVFFTEYSARERNRKKELPLLTGLPSPRLFCLLTQFCGWGRWALKHCFHYLPLSLMSIQVRLLSFPTVVYLLTPDQTLGMVQGENGRLCRRRSEYDQFGFRCLLFLLQTSPCSRTHVQPTCTHRGRMALPFVHWWRISLLEVWILHLWRKMNLSRTSHSVPYDSRLTHPCTHSLSQPIPCQLSVISFSLTTSIRNCIQQVKRRAAVRCRGLGRARETWPKVSSYLSPHVLQKAWFRCRQTRWFPKELLRPDPLHPNCEIYVGSDARTGSTVDGREEEENGGGRKGPRPANEGASSETTVTTSNVDNQCAPCSFQTSAQRSQSCHSSNSRETAL